MLHRVTFIAGIALALAGCGAGTDAPREAAARDSQPSDGGALTAQADPGSALSRDMAAAEARKAPAKPAVDTSQLRTAPAWQLVDLDGKPVDSKLYDGKVVIIDFWATWCGPCRKGIPDLVNLYSRYKDQGVEILGVSLDQQGPVVVKPFVQQFKMNYPVLMGNQKIVADFGGIRGIPTAFVISQDGKIYKKYVGLRPGTDYEKDIKDLLGITG